MHRILRWVPLLIFAAVARAAEHEFDWTDMPLNQPPTNCASIVAGEGKPGTWKVITDDLPMNLGLAPLNNGALTTSKKEVVAQLSQDFTDEHFPMLILGDDSYTDFKLTTKFKIVNGVAEQMAGIAFRIQDEKNFYVLRASALGRNVRFYKVVNNVRGAIIGPDMEVTAGVWHELGVECRGNEIDCTLDGKTVMPTIHDSSFGGGRIAYWTKSDAVSYFTDTRITYTPREPFVQGLVRETMTKYPRLLGLQVVMLTGHPAMPHLVASDKQQEIGEPGRKSAIDVIQKGTVYYDKQADRVIVTMPLRDRNGDAQAAVRVTMRSFKGQSEESAILRALPIVKEMQARAPASNDWND
jgi:hypothetical protein